MKQTIDKLMTNAGKKVSHVKLSSSVILFILCSASDVRICLLLFADRVISDDAWWIGDEFWEDENFYKQPHGAGCR